jgi:hypothetical protein
LPARLYEKHGTRTVVIFDEFQDILSTRDRVDAVIRSEIQHHGDAASYIFAGSHVGMMRDLFVNKRRAFYGQASPLNLLPLPFDDIGEYVADRFETTGRSIGAALGPLLDTAQGHPQRTMFLAHVLWDLTPPGATATEATWFDAHDQAMLQLHDELRALWSALPTYQQRVLAAVADGSERVYAASRRHGGSRGAAPGRAIQALLDRGEIVADAATKPGYRVVDPLLATWVKQGRPDA